MSPLLIAAKCDLPYPPPPIELCGSDLVGSMLLCNDTRIEKPENQNYSRALTKGDLCTNADDYSKLESHDLELRAKIAKLEKKCKL